LTDGTVICLETGTNKWHRLAPDQNGSYLNGQWDTAGFAVPPMPDGRDTRIGTYNSGTDTDTPCNPCTFNPRFFASGVLPNGQVVVIGGEDIGNLSVVGSKGKNTQVESNIGFIYTPGNPNFTSPGVNTWGAQLTELFGSGNVGDAPSVILRNGTFALANNSGRDLELLDPATGTFTRLNSTGKRDSLNEEGLNILPDDTILVVDARQTNVFELLTLGAAPSWSAPNLVMGKNMPVNIPDFGPGTLGTVEVGPGVLRPDGQLVYFTSNIAGQNAMYDYVAQTWSHTADMDFENDATFGQFSAPDAPATLLPNGNVLIDANPVYAIKCAAMAPPPPPACGVFNTPSRIYSFDFATNKLNSIDQPANAASVDAFEGRMLLLPTGEVLFTTQDFAGSGAQLYTKGGTPQDAWRPTIASVAAHIAPDATYDLSGTLFNGFSEGAKYGDDAQMATNYPLVRIKNNATSHVFYARTHDHSRMGVEPVGSTEVVTTRFDTPSPAHLENGASTLVVVANGIASAPVDINVFPNLPPVAKCKPFSEPYTSSAGGVCVGSFVSSDIDNGSFDPDGDPIQCTPNPPGPLGLGSHSVTLTCSDPSGASDSCTATVTIVDTTPPVFDPFPPSIAQTVCNTATQPVALSIPTATDACFPSVPVTGSVISANGVTLSPPIPVGTGSITLAPGVYVIEWTATDGAGNTTVASQTLTVRAGIEASEAISMDAHSNALLPSAGGFAMLANTGTGDVKLHNEAKSGGILSQGPVQLGPESVVNGNVQSAGTVDVNHSATVTGTIAANTTVVLPAGLDLSGVVFPSTNSGPVRVRRNETRALSPAAYGVVRVDPAGKLVLTTGTYFFEELDLDPSSRVDLDQAAGPVSLYVRNKIEYHGQIASISGSPGGFVLGFAGTSPLEIQTRFLGGTVIAPTTTVTIALHGQEAFRGELFAQSIVIKEGATLVCDPVGLSAQQAGLSAASVLSERASGHSVVDEADASGGATAGCSVTARKRSGSGYLAAWGVFVAAAAAWRRRGRRAGEVRDRRCGGSSTVARR
jgi:hypothetical protein